MLYNQAQALLKRAAGAALERIAGDRARSPWKVRPLLGYLETNLFDPDLNVDQLKRACGVRDNSIAVAFHAAVGQPPGAYITERRLETAGKLLRESKLPVWQVSDLVGYSSIQVFSRSFSRWAGKGPSSYRREATGVTPTSPALAASELHATGGLIPAFQPQTLLRRQLDLEKAEELEAEELWLALRSQAWERQREIVQQPLGFRSPAFFECLLKKTRQEGREDRGRGVQIAELAIESLAALQGTIDPARLAGLEARGWAWLGNAYRLVLNFQGAETAFRVAEKHLARVPGDLLASAEVLQNRGALFWFQRRYEDALELEERALDRFRALGKPDLLAQALVLKAAIHEYTGDLGAAIPELAEALDLAKNLRDGYLNLTIHHALIVAHVRTGRYEQAAEFMPAAKSLTQAVGGARLRAHMAWIEGRWEQVLERWGEAEARYLEARAGFDQIDDSYHSALVALDLTAVYSPLHRFGEIVGLAADMLRVFAALEIPRETLAALNALKQGTSNQEKAQELIEKVQAGLEELLRDPRRQTLRR